MKSTPILFVLFSMTLASFAQASTYSCKGGTGDVSVAFDARTKQIIITNSECGVRMGLRLKRTKAQTAPQKAVAFRGIEADDSDVDLCGSSSVISAGILTGATVMKMALYGGESAGQYACRQTQN